jgi:hypothetical protein
MHKPTKPFRPSLGSDLGAFAQEMFGLDSASPLKKSEIREGIARLMASSGMTSAEGRKGEDGKEDDFTGALDTACDLRSDAGPSLFRFAEKWGLEGNVPGVIRELGFALLMERVTPEELFRLGTSPEAIAMFEKHEKWWAERVRAHNAAEATS